jgi:hypothetical protein
MTQPAKKLSNPRAGHHLQTRATGCSPAAFAGDQLIPAVGQRPDQNRLENSVLSDRGCQIVQAGLVHGQAGLVWIRLDPINRDVANRGWPDDCRLVSVEQAQDVLGKALAPLFVEARCGGGSEIWPSQAQLPPWRVGGRCWQHRTSWRKR